jgi:hypothetical protein
MDFHQTRKRSVITLKELTLMQATVEKIPDQKFQGLNMRRTIWTTILESREKNQHEFEVMDWQHAHEIVRKIVCWDRADILQRTLTDAYGKLWQG